MTIPRPVMEAINRSTKQQLVDFLMCEPNSGSIFGYDGEVNAYFDGHGPHLENGDGALTEAVQERIRFLEREEDARALCFQRAAELRAKKNPAPVNGEDMDD